MKKNVVTLIVIGLFVAGIYLVSELFRSKPPLPTLTVGGKEVEVVRGSYCWNGLINSGCVDMTSPPDLIKDHELTPIAVSPESEMEIEFKKEPQDNTLHVNEWINEEQTKEVPVHDNAILLPKEKGIYVYDVSARWDRGDSIFAFIIEVD